MRNTLDLEIVQQSFEKKTEGENVKGTVPWCPSDRLPKLGGVRTKVELCQSSFFFDQLPLSFSMAQSAIAKSYLKGLVAQSRSLPVAFDTGPDNLELWGKRFVDT